MPIRAVDRSRYPADWLELSQWVKFVRAGGRCEFLVDGERCTAIHGQPHPLTGARVILTTAHLDHTPEHNDRNPAESSNLRAGCQRCHNRHDRMHRNATRRKWFIRPRELFPVTLFPDAPIELGLTRRTDG